MKEKKDLKEFISTSTGKFVFIGIFYFIFITVFAAVSAISFNSDAPYIMFVFCALFVYFGWKALNRITPRIFLIMPIIGWFFYFTIKFILAYFVGVAIAPYKIAKMIAEKI
ncbi:MAG: hypothetical protein IKJ27_11360 [Clostridia bacterium]|nr:hypothetical protein [Clostridia bacterium]